MTTTLAASRDVAHDKSSVDSYGITHILNLDPSKECKFDDDLNYKCLTIPDDVTEAEFGKKLDECVEFIDEGRHYGNVLVHCDGATGLSPATTVCVAYVMQADKKKLDEALAGVKEARPLVKPSELLMKQLRQFEVKLLGVQVAKAAGIDDPFALRKKQEIEAEKAALASSGGVKNRMKMFAANLEAQSAAANSPASRSKSASPNPYKIR